MAPTIHVEGPYAFRFYSADHNEPAHIHVHRDRDSAKLWLDPVALARNHGFPPHELQRIGKLVSQNQQRFLEAWYDYFDARA